MLIQMLAHQYQLKSILDLQVKDIDDFSASFSEISNYVGEFDFGLSSSSDAIRIFNSEMVITG